MTQDMIDRVIPSPTSCRKRLGRSDMWIVNIRPRREGKELHAHSIESARPQRRSEEPNKLVTIRGANSYDLRLHLGEFDTRATNDQSRRQHRDLNLQIKDQLPHPRRLKAPTRFRSVQPDEPHLLFPVGSSSPNANAGRSSRG
ncbi:hypothetical protein FPOAC2_08962 [Fusarium poae]|jgi:hypothetical protein